MKRLVLYSFLFFACLLLHSKPLAPALKLVDVWAYGEIVTDSAVLETEQNNLRFYCAPEADLPLDSVEYEFFLEGYDKTWYVPFPTGWFFYTNLKPGHYVFHARCRFHNGEWGPELTHPFTIACPWWRTWWAYTLYILILFVIVVVLLYLYRERVRLNTSLKAEHEMKRFRNEFVMQAGREFRTPLTIIRSIVEKFSGTGDEHLTRTDIKHLRNSSTLLMRMVEDLMEYRAVGQEASAFDVNDVLELPENPLNDYSVVVLEPDAQLADVISREMQKYFKTKMCTDPTKLLPLLKESSPHLVILDTEIKPYNAFELLKEIRKDRDVLVILISDLTDKRSIIRALRSDADDYLPKPFNVEVLSAVALKRINVWMRFKNENKEGEVKNTPMTAAVSASLLEKRSDRLFVDSLNHLIISNLSNESLDVNFLAEKMKLSRAHLGRRMKILCGLTPKEYIRNMRMERVATLLKETDMSIQEIMFEVGISDSNTFYRRFKDHFGITPTEYRNRL